LFLAYLPPEEADAILNQPLVAFTDNTVTTPEMIRDQLKDVRERGYSVDYEEYELGICAVAAPIFNRSGTVIAAIGGPSPTSRMTPERITEIAEAYKGAARAISRRMGYDR
jgi:IclR family acetate operon transcriptional repressor